MNKGLAVHILISIVFFIFYFWITCDIEVDVAGKLITTCIFFIIHGFASAPISDFGDSNNLYKQKL